MERGKIFRIARTRAHRAAFLIPKTFLMVSFAIAGCGGQSEDSSGGSSGGNGGSSSGGGTGTGASSSTGGTVGQCPSAVPESGTECEPPSGQETFARADCSWGDDPRPHCRTTGSCQNGTWSVTEPVSGCESSPFPAECLEVMPVDGTDCTNPGETDSSCWYDNGSICVCSSCAGGSEYPLCMPTETPHWYCSTPDTACPYPLPQAGTPCNQEGLNCGPNCEYPIVCDNGIWTWPTGACPICAAPSTRIATPGGERPIADLQLGDIVYSIEDEAVVAVPLIRVGRTPVQNHSVVRILFDNGRTLEMSPGHPTASGKLLGELEPGEELDASRRVLDVQLVPYEQPATHDILPATSSGTYFAEGALVGSTLSP